MRTFLKFNPTGDSICPICGTFEEKETLLVPIIGTEDENVCEAVQVHTECFQSAYIYDREKSIIYAICKFKDKQ